LAARKGEDTSTGWVLRNDSGVGLGLAPVPALTAGGLLLHISDSMSVDTSRDWISKLRSGMSRTMPTVLKSPTSEIFSALMLRLLTPPV
jgi:hypothetical protein